MNLQKIKCIPSNVGQDAPSEGVVKQFKNGEGSGQLFQPYVESIGKGRLIYVTPTQRIIFKDSYVRLERIALMKNCKMIVRASSVQSSPQQNWKKQSLISQFFGQNSRISRSENNKALKMRITENIETPQAAPKSSRRRKLPLKLQWSPIKTTPVQKVKKSKKVSGLVKYRKLKTSILKSREARERSLSLSPTSKSLMATPNLIPTPLPALIETSYEDMTSPSTPTPPQTPLLQQLTTMTISTRSKKIEKPDVPSENVSMEDDNPEPSFLNVTKKTLVRTLKRRGKYSEKDFTFTDFPQDEASREKLRNHFSFFTDENSIYGMNMKKPQPLDDILSRPLFVEAEDFANSCDTSNKSQELPDSVLQDIFYLEDILNNRESDKDLVDDSELFFNLFDDISLSSLVSFEDFDDLNISFGEEDALLCE